MSDIPEGLVAERRALLAKGLSPAEFQGWRHNPITAAFLQHLEDLAANAREAFMTLWESGGLEAWRQNPDLHPEFLRGEVKAYEHLARITLEPIRAFYEEAERFADSMRQNDEQEPPDEPKGSGVTGY